MQPVAGFGGGSSGSMVTTPYAWQGSNIVGYPRSSNMVGGVVQYYGNQPTVYGSRTAQGVQFTRTPSQQVLQFAGLAPDKPFQVNGSYYQYRNGALTAVNAEGQTQAETITSQAQQAQDDAKQANEQRYQEILEGYQNLGNQAGADISRLYQGMRATGYQDLVSRGLAGTTIAPTMNMAYAREETNAQARLQEQVRREQLGFMERRTDAYPDQSAYLNLLAQLGQWGRVTA
jgi:hypothetical protein